MIRKRFRYSNGCIVAFSTRRDSHLPPADKRDMIAPSNPPDMTPELSLLHSRRQASDNNGNKPGSHFIPHPELTCSLTPANVATSLQPPAERQSADHIIVIDTPLASSSVLGIVGTSAPGHATSEERHAQWDSTSNWTSDSDDKKSCPPPYEP